MSALSYSAILTGEQYRGVPLPILPSLNERYTNLVTTGKQFDRSASRDPLGEGLTHLTWRGETVAALVDQQIMQSIPRIDAIDPAVKTALTKLRDGIPAEAVAPYLERKLSGNGIIIGFSGYASGGYGYEAEAEGIKHVLQTCKQRGMPIDLVVDGGTSLGIPGLSGLLSGQEGIDTLGCIPLEGLRSVAPRDALVVLGTHYGDETRLIGAIPDVLFILGGGPNATKEYQAALDADNTVVLLKLKTYPPNSLANTYELLPETQEALRLGKLIVGENLDSLTDIITSIDSDRLAHFRANRARKTVSPSTQ